MEDGNNKLNGVIDVSKNDSHCNMWTLTNNLRWKEIVEYKENGGARFGKELQQMMISDTGEQKWASIEYVN